MSNHKSTNAPGLPSRRFFLARATAGLAGSLVAAAAVGQPALAALPPAAILELSDPIFALAERFLEADGESDAAYTAADEFEPMQEWRKKNPMPDAEAWLGMTEAEHPEALRKWNRRRRAAERRTGYRKLQHASDGARRRFFEAQEALRDAIPLTWDGLAAKTRAFRATYGFEERGLMSAILRDIAVLSGQIDRANALLLSDEELANV